MPVPYRGPFGQLLTLMMPGLFCFAMILYAINPIFQIAKRTAPLVAAAVVGCLADPAILFLLPHRTDASDLAVAQSGAFAAALVTLVAVACLSRPAWPRARDLAATALATLAMTAALLPLRSQPPGVLVLAAQVGGGVLVYAAMVAAFDIAGMRSLLLERSAPSDGAGPGAGQGDLRGRRSSSVAQPSTLRRATNAKPCVL